MDKWLVGCLTAIGGVGFLCLLACGGCFFFAASVAPSGNAAIPPAKQAEIVAREHLKVFLKYPENSLIHAGVNVYKQDGGRWVVVGKVDAMNALGAKPTLPWRVDLLVIGDGDSAKWDATIIRLGDDVLYQAK